MKPENFIKNFRDLGKSIHSISGDDLFPQGVLYRGGSLNSVFDHDEILNIPTILNLRSGKDAQLFDCKYLHFPAENKMENYDTKNKKVKRWINNVISGICQNDTKLPIYIHCTSGKDRTGVIIAAILRTFDISDDLIIKEYLLSDGVEGSRDIMRALDGFGDINQYLKGGGRKVVNKLSR